MTNKATMSPVKSLATGLFLLASFVLCTAQPNRRWHQPQRKQTQITDFRYSSARIDGITRLFNDSLIVLSNGQYWVLDQNEMPRTYNVRGSTSQLYGGFDKIDAIWSDPYNDISPQIYLVSTNSERGLRVVCKEFDDEGFTSESSFCHLPVDAKWKTALKDLDFDKPIDAVTWRNRTKDKDGGFWVFFQGAKMVTIDPYDMRLRYTYDLARWMNISEPITATFYDYRSHVYHFFFDQNGYRTWKVNVSFMNSLPMSWDRAFLHGTLSPLMKINRHFFGFSEREVRNWPQPYFDKIAPISEINENRVDGGSDRRSTVVPNVTRRPSTAKTTVTSTRRWTTTENSMSDVLYVSQRGEIVHNQFPSGKLKIDDSENSRKGANSLEQEESDSISYQKQLMQLDQEGVRDFAPDGDALVNAAGPQIRSPFSLGLLVSCISWLCMTLL